jgi:hypothetical protein
VRCGSKVEGSRFGTYLHDPPNVRLDALHDCKPSQQAAPGNEPNAWFVSCACLRME